MSNIGSVWFFAFPIIKMTPFPLIKGLSCQESDVNFPAMQWKMKLFRGHDTLARFCWIGTRWTYWNRNQSHLLWWSLSWFALDVVSIKIQRRWIPSTRWNSVWLISVFALAAQSAFQFLGFSFMILNKERFDFHTSCPNVFFHQKAGLNLVLIWGFF